eukprot:2790635-Prymnesium_polylepis.1
MASVGSMHCGQRAVGRRSTHALQYTCPHSRATTARGGPSSSPAGAAPGSRSRQMAHELSVVRPRPRSSVCRLAVWSTFSLPPELT